MGPEKVNNKEVNLAKNSGNLRRIFVGISFKEDLQEPFSEVFRKLKTSAGKKDLDIKWTRPENLHLTLNFLGEISDEQTQELCKKLSELASEIKPFTVSIKDLGGLPDDDQARVLYMGVRNKKELRTLQESIDARLEPIGLNPVDHDYVPHITLARLRNKKNIKDLISPFARRDFGDVPVDKIQVFESFLQQNFPVYKIVEEFELRA